MTYELAKKLKEAGFKYDWCFDDEDNNRPVCFPTLSELIEACGFCFEKLEMRKDDRTPEHHLKFSGWRAIAWDADDTWQGDGQTPEEAVANLWLKLHAN